MRILKMPYVAVVGGIALLLLIGVVAWQAGWLDEMLGTSKAAYAPNPDDLRDVRAVFLVAENQRLREELGESDPAKRESSNAARVRGWAAAGVSDSQLADLNAERHVLAQRYFAAVEAALAHPQWPSGAEAFEGNAAFYEAKANDLLREARSSFIYAEARGVLGAAALNDAAQARAIAQGRTTRPMSFNGLELDANLALVELLPVDLKAPARGSKPTPPTALSIPGLN